jgi:hypothetical protein
MLQRTYKVTLEGNLRLGLKPQNSGYKDQQASIALRELLVAIF